MVNIHNQQLSFIKVIMRKTLILPTVIFLCASALFTIACARKATINGQAFLTTRGGEVRVAAGCEVYLFSLPDFEEWHRSLGLSKKSINDYISSDLKELPDLKSRVITITDANSNFEFTSLPLGKYILFSTVIWDVGGQKQGGTVYNTVNLATTKSQKVMLNKLIRNENGMFWL